jgi:hypothetical protein
MGMIYEHTIPEKLEGLSPRYVLNFYPFMKLDIDTHEKECPALKKEDEPLAQ